MKDNVLAAKPRTTKGKGAARKLRQQDLIPGVFYFRGTDNIPISISNIDLTRILKEKHSLIKLEIEGQKPRECVIRELQRDPVYDTPLHIDFLGIKRGQRLIVTIPVKLEGQPSGVKNDGGILQMGLSELDIKCLPKDIPTEITVDVTDLNIGQSLYIRDLDLPLFEFLDEPKSVLATVVPPTIVRTAATEEVEEEEEETGEEESTPEQE